MVGRKYALCKPGILHPNPQLVIQTDASKKGWGAVLGSQEIGGRWMDSEATNHINILELQAAFFALKAFCKHSRNTLVQLQIDNTTAVAYIMPMGGSKSHQLNELAKIKRCASGAYKRIFGYLQYT